MPFVKVDPIQEARELQEIFKKDIKARETFQRFELEHIEVERLWREGTQIMSKSGGTA
jgi:hypothetical protein